MIHDVKELLTNLYSQAQRGISPKTTQCSVCSRSSNSLVEGIQDRIIIFRCWCVCVLVFLAIMFLHCWNFTYLALTLVAFLFSIVVVTYSIPHVLDMMEMIWQELEHHVLYVTKPLQLWHAQNNMRFIRLAFHSVRFTANVYMPTCVLLVLPPPPPPICWYALSAVMQRFHLCTYTYIWGIMLVYVGTTSSNGSLHNYMMELCIAAGAKEWASKESG